jgi:hypothetical protein
LQIGSSDGSRATISPDPAEEVRQVVAALNAKFASKGVPERPFAFVDPPQARFTRDRLDARARGPGQEHTVLVDLASGEARVSTLEQVESHQAPFAMRGLKVPGGLAERVKSGLPKALTQHGLAADEAGIAVGTELVFHLRAEGRVWQAKYNVQTGTVTGTPLEARQPLGLRRFLTQLHMSHGYPSQGAARWLWAVCVDAMFVSMVFWGLSGVLMWWQIKAVRKTGAVVLATSLAVAALLACGMHAVLQS